MQFHASFRIRVRGGENLAADGDLTSKFFLNFTNETRFERFARIALPARKLPEAAEMDARRPARHEVRAVPYDDRGGHDNSVHVQWRSFAGLCG